MTDVVTSIQPFMRQIDNKYARAYFSVNNHLYFAGTDQTIVCTYHSGNCNCADRDLTKTHPLSDSIKMCITLWHKRDSAFADLTLQQILESMHGRD